MELCVDQDVSARGGGRGKLSSWGGGARSAKLSSQNATTVQQNLRTFADIQEKNDALGVSGTHNLQTLQHLQHLQQTVAPAEREVLLEEGDEVSGVLLLGGGWHGGAWRGVTICGRNRGHAQVAADNAMCGQALQECAGEVDGRTHTHTHT